MTACPPAIAAHHHGVSCAGASGGHYLAAAEKLSALYAIILELIRRYYTAVIMPRERPIYHGNGGRLCGGRPGRTFHDVSIIIIDYIWRARHVRHPAPAEMIDLLQNAHVATGVALA